MNGTSFKFGGRCFWLYGLFNECTSWRGMQVCCSLFAGKRHTRPCVLCLLGFRLVLGLCCPCWIGDLRVLIGLFARALVLWVLGAQLTNSLSPFLTRRLCRPPMSFSSTSVMLQFATSGLENGQMLCPASAHCVLAFDQVKNFSNNAS